MRRRRWLAIAGLSCALLGAWAAIAFLRETRGDERGASSDRTAAATAGVDPASARSAGESAAPRDESRSHELTPIVVAAEPRLDWPDAATLRRITRRGRTLFGGVVYAPDGSPCPGATVWCNGLEIATSDDHGAWRADVSRSPYYDFDADVGFNGSSPSTYLLVARKEGIGYVEVGVDASSRRVDLRLEGCFAFRGTVVDNDDLHPVGGAELEARIRWLVLRVQADASGAFAFADLPSGNLDLSGRAPGYDSNGSFPYNFDRGRDVTITFRITKAYRLRGQFVPWPSPGIDPAGAQVVLTTRSPHEHSETQASKAGVGPDGAFDVALPVCPDCRVGLTVADGMVWQTSVDMNEEPHDVDLGRIELPRPAAVVGRVEVEDERMRAAILVMGSVMLEAERPAFVYRRVAADGTFRLAPLPAGPCTVEVEIEGYSLASLAGASALSSAERSDARIDLAPGETRDVGVLTTGSVILFGTVRDSRGEPIVLAQVRDLLGSRSLSSSRQPFRMFTSDEDGRYCGVLGSRDTMTSPLDVTVRARGFAPIRLDVECPPGAGWIRRDFVLEDGVVLRGTLEDESGAPLSEWSIRATPAAATDERADDVTGFDVTQADGTFEIRGLAAGEWKIRALPNGGNVLEFTKIHPERGAITLRTSDGVAVATAR
jgi:hypothetical protein